MALSQGERMKDLTTVFHMVAIVVPLDVKVAIFGPTAPSRAIGAIMGLTRFPTLSIILTD